MRLIPKHHMNQTFSHNFSHMKEEFTKYAVPTGEGQKLEVQIQDQTEARFPLASQFIRKLARALLLPGNFRNDRLESPRMGTLVLVRVHVWWCLIATNAVIFIIIITVSQLMRGNFPTLADANGKWGYIQVP